MKDKDFEDIGKRLRDLEADPPQNGWSKIYTSLEVQSTKDNFVWFRKYWSKFLVLLLLIPAGIYVLSFNQFSIKNWSSKKGEATETLAENSVPYQTTVDGTDKTTNDRTEKTDTKIGDGPGITNTDRETANLTEPLTDGSNIKKHGNRKPKKIVSDSDNGNARRHVKQQVDIDFSEDEISGKGVKQNDSNNFHENAFAPSTDAVLSNNNGDTTLSESFVARNNDAVTYLTNPEVITIEKLSVIADSVAILLKTLVFNKADSVSYEEERKNSYSKWRLTFSFLPQYGNKTVKPVTSDDVLVTGLKRKDDPSKIDLGFSVGIGKALKENLYLDAQILYSEEQHNAFLSYATGKVDTLLAVQQNEQSVRIMPVYETATREFSNRYRYVGFRFGATQYFWANTRRRFNISTMIGAQYLASANIREKINGTWTPVSNSGLNKLNYTAMLGVGYNLNLNRGWELMINPSITYYLRSVKNAELPYNFRQQSYGLNLMLSKEIGSK